MDPSAFKAAAASWLRKSSFEATASDAAKAASAAAAAAARAAATDAESLREFDRRLAVKAAPPEVLGPTLYLFLTRPTCIGCAPAQVSC